METKIKIVTFLFLIFILVFNSSCSKLERDFIEYSKDVMESTVFIIAVGNQEISYGTGFVIDKEGYVLTASHVLDGHENNIFVLFIDYDGTCTNWYDGTREVIKLVSGADLAIVKITPNPDHKLKTVRLRYKDIKIGQNVAFVGFPWTAQEEQSFQKFEQEQILPFLKERTKPTRIIKFLSQGVIASKFWEIREKGTLKYYFVNTCSNPGESGGPVFLKSTGEVVGITKGGKVIPIGIIQDGNVTKMINETLPFGVLFVTPIEQIPKKLEDLKIKKDMVQQIHSIPSGQTSNLSFNKLKNLSQTINLYLLNFNLYPKICIEDVCK